MDARLSLVTLGVSDVSASRSFYERLGWRASPASQPGVAFFQLNGVVLSLYGRDDLARDIGHTATGAGAAVSLAINFTSREEVDAAFAEAVSAGAIGTKPPQAMFWGGYCAFVADPDGFVWEYAHNPFFPLDEAGRVVVPS